MSNALADVIADNLSKDYIERRADDWAKRIERLFDRIVPWLPEGWTAQRSTETMHEEMMRRHDVPARDIMVLRLEGPNGASATISPYGLWVVGANGHLDFDAPNGRFVILDRADTDLGAPKSEWTIAPLRDRGLARVLEPQAFAAALCA